MVVVFADEARIAAAIQPYAREVSIAALNGPQNTVISGRREAVEAVVATLHADEVKTRKLGVSHAFHSPLMEPILTDFEQVAREVSYSSPRIGLISNVTGRLATDDITTSEYWCRHIRQLVRFGTGMETLYQQGYELFVEIGPKPTLLGMGSQCLPGDVGVWLPSMRRELSDWEQLLLSLGRLYVCGVEVDWLGFDRDYPRRRVVLPTYPFQRQRYWIDVSESAHKTIAPSLTAARSRSIHPLLGQRLHLAGTQEIRFESKISRDSPAFITQYRVYETAIVPATAYLEMALAAAAEAFGPSFHIVAALEFQRALFLPGGASPTLQLSLSADVTGGASFSIHSHLANATKPSQAWTLHAIGKVVEAGEENAADNLEPSSPETTQARCPQVVAGPDFYRQLRERGFQPGPSFEGIEQLWRGEGEALGRVSLPRTLEAQVQDYQFHPALLDACLQVLGAAASVDATENGRGGLYVPVRMGQVRLSARPSRGLWSYARLRTESDKTAGTLEGDVLVFDDAGQMVAEVHCLRLQRLDREVGHLTQVNVSDWLYELQWYPKSHLGQVLAQLSPDYLLPLPQIADRVQSRVMQLSARHGLQQYLELKPRLDSLSVAYVVKAFRQLGWKFGLNERVLINNLAEQWGVVDKHRRLLGRMFEMLESDGVLTKVDGDWRISRVPEITDPQETWHALLAQFPACKAELTLISQCGLRLADVLRGNVDPLTLLFSGGSMELVESLYKDSPFTCIYNRLIQETISTALERLPEGRTVRILEVGAGTGATTSYLLPRLSANRTEYVFTDLSNLFTTTAKHKFRDYPFVRYALLDVEQDIEAQGFAPHQFDMILAANVLHATSDLRYTLSNVRRLLTSQGMLILLEATSDQPWLDLIFGLTEGWWKFADLDLRPSHPLLSRRKWFNLLAKQGFTQLASLPTTKPESGCELEQIVILARGPRVEHKPRLAETITRPTEPRATWLIFADREGVGQALGEIIRSRNEHSILVSPSKVYSRAERNHYHIRPERPEDIRQLLAEALGPNDLPFRGIIHLWSLDAASTDEITATSLEAEQTLVCGSVLHLVQALADGGSWANAYPRLWLVTRGAQLVGTWANIAVVQASLWGLGRVLRQEHPELWGGLVDLDPECSAQDASCLLWGELKCPDGEDQIAYRLGQRYVARLIRLREAAGQTRPLKWQRNGSYLITGGLGNLGLLVARWMVEQGARRLILIGRTKLPPRADWHQVEADSRMAHQIVAIRELEALGASVHIASVDVADEAQLTAFLDEYRRESWPPIVGVVHLAAVLRDGMVAQTDVAALNAVLRPKSTGAWYLHRLLEDASLDFFVLFSSAASLLGQPGHGSYAAANAFLDALAYYRRAHGLPVLSINWGAWANIGFATTPGGQRLARHLALMGIESIPLRQGLEALEQLLRQGMAQAAVLPVNWAQYRQFYPAAGEPPLLSYLKHERDDELSRADSQTEEVKQVSEQQHELLQRLKRSTASDREELLAVYVQDRITKILRLDSSIQPARDQSLGELGFDSLMGTQLENRFRSELGVDVPIKEFIGRVSIAQLIGLLLDHLILSSLARSELPSSDISEDMEEIAL
jgi:acyl transferase domain-containing protein/trans-aconitate methyltransferase